MHNSDQTARVARLLRYPPRRIERGVIGVIDRLCYRDAIRDISESIESRHLNLPAYRSPF